MKEELLKELDEVIENMSHANTSYLNDSFKLEMEWWLSIYEKCRDFINNM